MYVNRKDIKIGQLLSLEMAVNSHEKDIQFQKPCKIAKSEKYKTFVSLSF